VAGYRAGDPTIRGLLHAADWFLVPVLNPDGYAYTQYLTTQCLPGSGE
jgi:murein tripeptide amidase MpaA